MTWTKKKKNILAVVLVAVLVIVAIFGIGWGFMHHSEETLLKVCWNDSQAEYVGETEVKSIDCLGQTEELIYPGQQIPLTVTTISYSNSLLTPDARDSKVIASAVDTINSQFGFELMKMAYRSDAINEDGLIKASVIVHTQVAYTPGSRALSSKVPGWAVHSRRADGSIQCDVYIRGGLSERYMYRVAVHELGHAIGFAHDDFKGSVMYPLTADDTESEHMLPSRFTDADRSRGSDLYLTKN
jgi:hypothetical protein